MNTPDRPGGDADPWAPYRPSADAAWDRRRVVHLHRRAGFAATWGEIQRDLADGPGPSVERLLAGKTRREGVPEDFAATADLLAERAVATGEPARLRAWWVYRMSFGPDPLEERLTLLWHNHFATGNAKVRDLALMRRQNDLFRRLARAPFGELLSRAVRDPALLLWLDAPANRREHPNENLGRELLELFTLGLGPYTEADVREAARALTGWTVADGDFHDDGSRHDPGEKVLFGRRGPWRGDDLVRLLLEHPATARRLAWRLCDLFLGEGVAGEAEVGSLAAGLREHDLDVGWAVETVVRSRLFFGEANLGNRVLGPVEFVVGSARALEVFDPPPSTWLLADWAARLGQDLFDPPNVGGWPGGRAWINTRSVIGRANYAAALVEGALAAAGRPPDVAALAARHGHGGDVEGIVRFAVALLLGTTPSAAWRDRLLASLAEGKGSLARRAVALVLASPEAQLV